ncbi:MAG: TerB family tellurite resistance protein [Chryseolinea sp.]
MIDPTRLEHFRNLVSLSAVDGNIKDIERVALSKIAYSHDIPLDRLNVMLSKATEYAYLIPQNTKDRERQLEEMIQLAWIDGEFAPAEKELIKMVGEKLGFSSGEIEHFIQVRRTE